MNRIEYLEKIIREARDAYYNSDSPIMSDKEFDTLVDELKELDSNNKAVTNIGAPIKPSEWEKGTHKISMGSLDKINTPEDLSKWFNNLGLNSDELLFVTEKLDGISIELIYENGKLQQSLTRGDGVTGENIFSNVVNMNGVKSNLSNSFTGSLRGEIILKKNNHKKYFSDKANPRNAASGIAKRLDGVGSEYLDIIFYQVIGDIEFDTEFEQFKWLEKENLYVPNYWVLKNVNEVSDKWKEYQDNNRDKLDYDIDGLVVRLNNLNKQLSFGSTNLRPKAARAFKFANQFVKTKVKEIRWEVGNSGRITPVCWFDPVNLLGSTIQKASVYNVSYIKRLGINIGSEVLVCKANEIIPRVEKVLNHSGKHVEIPSKCPGCGQPTTMVGENLMCLNYAECSEQVIGRVSNWIKELGILEWGSALIQRLVESGKVKTPADLYKLTVDDIAAIDRMGQKSAEKCHKLLWESCEIPLDVFLGALSIPMIGSTMIKLIMNAGCDTLEKFGQLNAEHFEMVDGVGPTKAASLAKGLEDNKDLIFALLNNGVKIKEKIIGKLNGYKIAITGSTEMKRADLIKLITDNGGEFKSSVGKSCTHVLIADVNSVSNKAQKARKLGIKLISEEDLFFKIK